MAEGSDALSALAPISVFGVPTAATPRHASTSKAMNNAKNTTLFPYLERLLEGEVVEWKTLGEVCDYIRGITYNKSAETTELDGWKVLRANNITLETRKLNFNEVKHVKKTIRVRENQMLHKGDILICAGSGSKEHIGKTAYIESDIDYTFGGFMGVLRLKEEKTISSRYLFHYIGRGIYYILERNAKIKYDQ